MNRDKTWNWKWKITEYHNDKLYWTNWTNKFTGIHPTNQKQRWLIVSFVTLFIYLLFWFSCFSLNLEDSNNIAGWHRSHTKITLFVPFFLYKVQSEDFQFNALANHIISMSFCTFHFNHKISKLMNFYIFIHLHMHP